MAITPASERDTDGEKHQGPDQHHQLGQSDEASVIVTAAGQITRRDVDRDDREAQYGQNRNESPPSRDVARSECRSCTGQHRERDHGPYTATYSARYTQSLTPDRTLRSMIIETVFVRSCVVARPAT
jgi:hypothetical protein